MTQKQMDELKVNDIKLDKIKFGCQERLNLAMMESKLDLIDPKIDFYFDYLMRCIVGDIQGYVWGEPAFHKVIKYPKDWFEFFKQRWFPKWLLKKYPIKYRYHTLDIKTIYPKIKISVPKEKYNLVINYLEEVDSEPKSDK
jgi:hypothetical protein